MRDHQDVCLAIGEVEKRRSPADKGVVALVCGHNVYLGRGLGEIERESARAAFGSREVVAESVPIVPQMDPLPGLSFDGSRKDLAPGLHDPLSRGNVEN